jgi:hypothetical protein
MDRCRLRGERGETEREREREGERDWESVRLTVSGV